MRHKICLKNESKFTGKTVVKTRCILQIILPEGIILIYLYTSQGRSKFFIEVVQKINFHFNESTD